MLPARHGHLLCLRMQIEDVLTGEIKCCARSQFAVLLKGAIINVLAPLAQRHTL